MYCPQCSQSITSNAQFCSKCGFPLENLRNLVESGGEIKATDEDKKAPELTERQKGIRQGIKIILLGVVLSPLHLVVEGMLPSVENTNLDDLPHLGVDALLWIILLAGLARLLYAFTFNRSDKAGLEDVHTGKLNRTDSQRRLSSPGVSVSDFRRITTGDIANPPAVTERTTSLLNDQ